VQIGVTAAGEAGPAPVLQQPGSVRKAFRCRRDHRLHSVRAEAVRQSRQKVGVGVDGVGEARSPPALGPAGRHGVQAGDLSPERLGQGPVDRLGAGRQHRGLIEPPHLHGVVDHGPRPVQLNAGWAAGDGVDAPVDVRRGRCIEGDLPLGGVPPSVQGGEVHIPQVHRPLDLPGGVPGQVDAVAGGFDPASAQGGEEGVDHRLVAGLRGHG